MVFSIVTMLSVVMSGAVFAQGANLALVAIPSASYTSGDTSVAALNDGNQPRNSLQRGTGAYGNWPRTGTQWVQYEWSQPISTSQIEVYWWDDRQGVRLPRGCRLLFWDGQQFVAVKQPVGLETAGDRFNVTGFEEITTTRLRLEMDGEGQFSTGILEWRVIDSGNSPRFAPAVTAGVDRVVVLGGRTYLQGTVKTLEPEGTTPVVWSKEAGPGDVMFADAWDLETTATFSEPGEYALRLTAGEPELAASSTLVVKVQSPPPATPLQGVDTKRFAVDNPLWNSRVKALIVNWIPHCIDKISDPELHEGGINNFIEAANKLRGTAHGPHRGYVFSNAWVLQLIEAICLALMVDAPDDPEIVQAQQKMKATLEDWIPKILAAQEPDGYLQTAYTLSDRERWSPRHRADHEGYVAGYLIEAAIAHHLLTGGNDPRLYDAARKLADCWDTNLGPAPKRTWYDGHQGMKIALARLARLVDEEDGPGKGSKYIQLAKFLADSRAGGSEYDQSHVPVVRQYEAVGHAVRAVYSYTGMADIAMATGDLDYQSAVESLWDNLIHRKYYVTGGIGSGETSEGFGPDYSLRNDAYCESCSSCGQIFFQHRLNLIHHDARYADLYEETLYNALLGSIDLEGKNFYYQNPLDARGPRYEWHGCPCCIGNIPKTILMLPTWTYLKGHDSIHVNLFIGSTVTVENVAGTDVQIVQRTDYPWDGQVSITVHPAAERRFSLKIRTPTRDVSELYTSTPTADGILSFALNGISIAPPVQAGYAVITRDWQSGDTVDLVLPLTVQRVRTDEVVVANRGRVALRYGPLVYSVESVDQDLNQALNSDAPLTTEWREDLLEGVKIIRGAWAGGDPLLAIPNYARANRVGDEQLESGERRRGAAPIDSMVWVREE
jgi:uncharacterized protein